MTTSVALGSSRRPSPGRVAACGAGRVAALMSLTQRACTAFAVAHETRATLKRFAGCPKRGRTGSGQQRDERAGNSPVGLVIRFVVATKAGTVDKSRHLVGQVCQIRHVVFPPRAEVDMLRFGHIVPIWADLDAEHGDPVL